MKKVMSWIVLTFAATVMIAGQAHAAKKIGVLVWSEENFYLAAKDGLLEQLKKEGFGAAQAAFTVENAGGNKAKAGELAHKFSTGKYDLVIAVGTSAAVAVAGEIKTTPVVFTMVYDPIESKIAAEWKSSGNNTTGTSSKVPMPHLLSALKQLAPVTRLAVLYTPGEKNSEFQLKDLEALQAETKIKVIPVPVARKEDVARVMPDVVTAADGVFLSGSSIVGSSASAIAEAATRAKIPTVAHLDYLVDKGVLLGVCANARADGVLAGVKAAKVLKGAKPASIPIETLKKMDVIINQKTAKSGHIQIPADFLKQVTRTVE